MRPDSNWRESPPPAELPPGVRRSPSGRIPQWAIDEAFGTLQDPNPWRSGPPGPLPPPGPAYGLRRKPRRGRTWAIGAGIALLMGLSAAPMAFERFLLPAVLPYLPGAPVPPPGIEAADAPLGQVPASTESHAYALQKSPDPGQPFAALPTRVGRCITWSVRTTPRPALTR